MLRLATLASFVLILAACEKSDRAAEQPISAPENGLYKGTFRRAHSNNNGVISAVSLEFWGNGWTGTSQVQKYPALCSGSYARNGNNELSFENICAWTAEFDWTLILSGTYKLSMDRDSLVFTKSYNGGYHDIYKLKKQ